MQDVKLKNTNSWASLANLSTPSSAKMKKEKTGASFELFKKQAKEKEERVSVKLFLKPTSWDQYLQYVDGV